MPDRHLEPPGQEALGCSKGLAVMRMSGCPPMPERHPGQDARDAHRASQVIPGILGILARMLSDARRASDVRKDLNPNQDQDPGSETKIGNQDGKPASETSIGN